MSAATVSRLSYAASAAKMAADASASPAGFRRQMLLSWRYAAIGDAYAERMLLQR
jgi:hypothetical protein